jgi:hypothetical protein
MTMLDLGYLIGMGGCGVAALSLPAIWRWPDMVGPWIGWVLGLAFVASTVLMSGVFGP